MALNILKEGLKIRSSASYAVNQNEVTVKPKICKDEVGSCVATKQKLKFCKFWITAFAYALVRCSSPSTMGFRI